MRKRIGIIGGGASGMVAAIIAAREGASVTVYEKNDRLGKKILATGNGKCNFSNLEMNADQYHSKDADRLPALLETFPAEDAIAFFEGLGMTVKEKNGYLYPLSEQASTVLDVLRFEMDRLKNVCVKTEANISEITYNSTRKTFCVGVNGEKETLDRIILASGGKAAPKSGSDGSGFQMAKRLGHSLVPVVPALVQLRCKEDFFKAIAGVRAEAEISFLDEGNVVKEQGEMQLTDYGISGIPVFQLSRNINYALKKKDMIAVTIDFLPGVPKEGFAQKMLETRVSPNACESVETYFTGLLNKKLMLLFVKLAGLKPLDRPCDVPTERLLRVYELCRSFVVHVNASNSFDNAQVSAGGVPLSEVTDTLESCKVPGLFFAGEVLDVDGRCGGYNLHWAWCSGHLAGKAAAKE